MVVPFLALFGMSHAYQGALPGGYLTNVRVETWELSGAKDAVGTATVIADGGYRGTGLTIPHRREPGQTELPPWKEEHSASHRKVRARVEHAFARMKTWKILRDCRLKGDGVHHAMLGIARATSPSPSDTAGRSTNES